MPINPIDIMRTQEASTIRHMENTRIQHAQEQISKNFQTIVEQKQNKPKEATKSENSEYRYDAKEKGNNSYYSANSDTKKKKEEEKKDSKQSLKSGGFDVLI